MPASANAPSMPVVQSAIETIVDEAISAAPDCVLRRAILPAINWAEVAPVKVALLISTLADARVTVPRWLAKQLLLAGHALPENLEKTLTVNVRARRAEPRQRSGQRLGKAR